MTTSKFCRFHLLGKGRTAEIGLLFIDGKESEIPTVMDLLQQMSDDGYSLKTHHVTMRGTSVEGDHYMVFQK